MASDSLDRLELRDLTTPLTTPIGANPCEGAHSRDARSWRPSMAIQLLSRGEAISLTTKTLATQETFMLSRLVRDEQGQDLIEYVLLGSFIAIVAIAGVSTLGTNINAWYSAVASWVTGKGTGAIP